MGFCNCDLCKFHDHNTKNRFVDISLSVVGNFSINFSH
jgi:hypothetical protein